jgi:hypothetical protein
MSFFAMIQKAVPVRHRCRYREQIDRISGEPQRRPQLDEVKQANSQEHRKQ